jgi:Leu/Phe-tRNA-protein transferase
MPRPIVPALNSAKAASNRGGFQWHDAAATMRWYRPDEHPDFVADALQPVASLVRDIVRLVDSDASPS